MWNNLKNFHKALIILVTFFVIFYVLGRILIPDSMNINQIGGYWVSPFVYSAFFVAPILTFKYSSNRPSKIFAAAILGLFLLVIIIPLTMFGGEWLGNFLNNNFSKNPFVGFFVFLYQLPAMCAIVSAMMFFGGA